MLLSMYASYHWAESEYYIIKMAVFIILVSFLSAYSGLPFGFFLVVFPVLSFPFYAYIARWAVGPPLYVEEFHGIRFLTIGGLVTEQFIHAFSFFLLVNLFGMILGYAASKIHRIRELGTTKYWNSLGFILGVIFIGVGLIALCYIPPHRISEVPFGLESGPTEDDGLALFLFGILVLAIVIGRILWSKISETPKEGAIKQVLDE